MSPSMADAPNGTAQQQQQQQQQQQHGTSTIPSVGYSTMHVVDQFPDMEPLDAASNATLRRESFLEAFTKSKGPPQIIILCVLIALGFGSTVGVVPAVMTDRYARLEHGYVDPRDCSVYTTIAEKPQPCLDGSADAQYGVSMEQMISNTCTFFTSSYVGSLSDEHGRKGIYIYIYIHIFVMSR
jgi:hypothetical protein